jgi:hypothetical protein
MNDNTLTVIAAAVDAGVAPLLWGEPGIGKTSLLEHTFNRWGYDTQVITGNVREPSDFAGLPVRQDDGTVAFAPPSWAVQAHHADKAVVVLDELSTSTPAVQAAMLRVVLDRIAGDFRLGDHVRFIAAANPPEQAADGYDLAPPLANRFLHLDVKADHDNWITGMTLGWDAATPDVSSLKVITEGVAQREAHMKSLVASYISHRPNMLSQVPTDAMTAGRAFPTPRTWDFAARVLARLHDNDNAARTLALKGLIGEGAAREFLVWVREADLPNPAEVLKDPAVYSWSDTRIDRTFAVLNGVVAYVGTRDLNQRLVDATFDVLVAAADCGRSDLTAAAWSRLQKVPGISEYQVPARFAAAVSTSVAAAGRGSAGSRSRSKAA